MRDGQDTGPESRSETAKLNKRSIKQACEDSTFQLGGISITSGEWELGQLG